MKLPLAMVWLAVPVIAGWSTAMSADAAQGGDFAQDAGLHLVAIDQLDRDLGQRPGHPEDGDQKRGLDKGQPHARGGEEAANAHE